nr:STAS domain-containing protein [Pseudenhygromyxa sp. WMMC2535]
METSLLAHARPQMVAAAVSRLCRRKASVYGQIGEEVCRTHVVAGLDALEQDLQTGKAEALRPFVYALVDGLDSAGLNYSDLRHYVQTLRQQVREVLGEGEAGLALLAASEGWFFDLMQVSTMRFMVLRDQALERESRRHGVERLETQLAELEIALAEKTELLDLIRQASTPIAPVVRGILVVPLVGTFDSFRAQLLTERLLQEVAKVQTRSVILDISGVPVLDSDAAQLLIRLARSVRLLGAEIILVGMSPENAVTIINLGIELSDFETCGSLQDGLARALVLQRMRIVPFAKH